jgi:deoxyhypusine synthase
VFEALSSIPSGSPIGSNEVVKWISSHLLNKPKVAGLLSCALKNNTRLYVPALTDSELGLYLWRFVGLHTGDPFDRLLYDPLADVSGYAEWLRSQREVAFVTIGGGVPRNWAQQLLPFLRSMDGSCENATGAKLPEVAAAIRICPDDERLGHLSGCTYSEGISWGKFSDSRKHNLVEVACDATICFPILAKALFAHLDRRILEKPARSSDKRAQ